MKKGVHVQRSSGEACIEDCAELTCAKVLRCLSAWVLIMFYIIWKQIIFILKNKHYGLAENCLWSWVIYGTLLHKWSDLSPNTSSILSSSHTLTQGSVKLFLLFIFLASDGKSLCLLVLTVLAILIPYIYILYPKDSIFQSVSGSIVIHMYYANFVTDFKL